MSAQCSILQADSSALTPKNPLGEQSHRHKPRVLSVEAQRAQVRPMSSAPTKVLPGAGLAERGTFRWADSPVEEERRPSAGQVAGRGGETLPPA